MQGNHLYFESIGKRFPGVRALDRVSMTACMGKAHALLGENGAGKSTLLKILSGVYQPDEGALSYEGWPSVFRSTSEAIKCGVAVIYQELNLVPEMSVAENLYLGNLPNRFGWLDRKRLHENAVQQLTFLEESIDPNVKVGTLPLAQRQMIEIAKALARNAKAIAFDEPTSSLSEREVQRLFTIIRQLKERGHIIIYVSHRLQEVFEICDSATVLRDGKVVESFDNLQEVGPETLVQKMVGRTVVVARDTRERAIGEPLLEVKRLIGPGLQYPVSFSIRAGEIVGLFGLVGAGRTELAKLLYGAVSAVSGSIIVKGKEVKITTPAAAIRNGIVFCPEDRKKEGLIPIRSVTDNINISVRRILARFGFWIDTQREIENAQRFVDKLQIKTPSLAQLVQNLSGGNQQKVILARWLSETINVILLDEPTRGIDVGSKSEIYSIVTDLARSGIGVLFISSELPEVLGIADRIMVMREGRLAAELKHEEATEEKVLTFALPGGHPVSSETNEPRD